MQRVCLDWQECDEFPNELPKGWLGLKNSDQADHQIPSIQVIQRSGRDYIRLIETQSYDWSVEGEEVPSGLCVESSLKGQRQWKQRRGENGSFKVVNHLGFADFSLNSIQTLPLVIAFEFVSKKFDFDSEYRQLVEDIAEFCQQLLLSWNAPTRLSFNANPEHLRKLLLEQFLFLKNFMTQERLSRLLEAISRNPHSNLIRESFWVPASAARSSDYLSNPVGMLRDWRLSRGGIFPKL